MFWVDEAWFKQRTRRPRKPFLSLVASMAEREREMIEAALVRKRRAHRGANRAAAETRHSPPDSRLENRRPANQQAALQSAAE